jgi:hypothetical protein
VSGEKHQWRSVRDPYGRTWYHPSVAGLVAANGGTPDPELIIRNRARQLVGRARQMGWIGPPYDVKVIASLTGLRVKDPRPLSEDQSALLFGTSVFTNANHREVRQRYSVGHEIIHTFFPDRNTSPGFTQLGDRDPDGEVEYLCQIGAAEIVMPEWCFRSQAASHPFQLRSAFALADLYEVSPEAALRRLVDCFDRPAAAVTLTMGLRKSERVSDQTILPGFDAAGLAPRPKLRIARRSHLSWSLRTRRLFFPTNKSVPDESICYTALAERQAGRAGVHEATEVWDITGLKACHVEVVAWLERNSLPAGGLCLLHEVD